MRAFACLLLLTACGSTPPPVAPTKPAPAPPPPVVAAPKPAPPPEPLGFVSVAFDQKWAFVRPGLGSISPRLMTEEEIGKKLPAHLRGQYSQVVKALADYRKASPYAAGSTASFQRAQQKRRMLVTLLTRTRKTFEAQLEKKAHGALGIAVARLRMADEDLSWTDHDRNLSYGAIAEHRESRDLIEPLERAVEATALDDVGRFARVELVHHLMATDRAREARPILDALLPVMPPDQTPQLHFRRGVLHSLDGDHEKAAQSFRDAHAELATTSRISRSTLIAAELYARHRALQFDRVIVLAAEYASERDQPAPVKPDPNPPPPPPPPRPARKKNPKLARAQALAEARTAGVLGVLSSQDSGLIALLGSSSYYGSTLGETDVYQLATDAVERTAKAPDSLAGSADFRAAILSRLATRALYRGDVAGAKKHAAAARDLGTDDSRDGLRVLRVLAQRAGDDAQVKQLDEALEDLRYGWASSSGMESDALDAEVRGKKPSDPKTDPKAEPAAARSVRSLVRVCLEPLHQRFPSASERDATVAEITLSAKVFPGGRVELEPQAEGSSDVLREVAACTKALAPRVLAHAPSSVRARIAVKSLAVPSGSMWSDSIGSGFGFGGLGSRDIGGLLGDAPSSGYGGLGIRGSGSGGGGTGEGTIGIGGGLGHRGSGKGSGSGYGRPAKPKPAPKKKP